MRWLVEAVKCSASWTKLISINFIVLDWIQTGFTGPEPKAMADARGRKVPETDGNRLSLPCDPSKTVPRVIGEVLQFKDLSTPLDFPRKNVNVAFFNAA
jgi:hypothetical protein